MYSYGLFGNGFNAGQAFANMPTGVVRTGINVPTSIPSSAAPTLTSTPGPSQTRVAPQPMPGNVPPAAGFGTPQAQASSPRQPHPTAMTGSPTQGRLANGALAHRFGDDQAAAAASRIYGEGRDFSPSGLATLPGQLRGVLPWFLGGMSQQPVGQALQSGAQRPYAQPRGEAVQF